jgi:elongation factor G
MSEVLNYSADINSLTGGRGVFSLEFDHYDDVPAHLSTKIIEEAKKRHEEKAKE